jgi:sarcosine oxidase delta subunit
MLKRQCCNKCELLWDGRYLAEGVNGPEILLMRYRQSSSFPLELRQLDYCPHCGREVEEHRSNKDNKNYCPSFAACSSSEHGQYVCKLESGKERQFLFNLLTHDEKTPQGSIDYPSPAYIEYCPYCGEPLRDKEFTKFKTLV